MEIYKHQSLAQAFYLVCNFVYIFLFRKMLAVIQTFLKIECNIPLTKVAENYLSTPSLATFCAKKLPYSLWVRLLRIFQVYRKYLLLTSRGSSESKYGKIWASRLSFLSGMHYWRSLFESKILALIQAFLVKESGNSPISQLELFKSKQRKMLGTYSTAANFAQKTLPIPCSSFALKSFDNHYRGQIQGYSRHRENLPLASRGFEALVSKNVWSYDDHDQTMVLSI